MKVLREYIRSLLEMNSDSEKTTNYVDALENKIFEFLFTKSTYDRLQDLNEDDEATVVLSTDIFDDFENINEVHIGLSVNSLQRGEVEAAYVCVPTEREKSNLVITLNIPYEYPKINGFQDWLSAELADTLSHEIQHSCDTTEMLSGGGNIPEGDAKWNDLDSIESYYASDAETRGHVAGILGRSRRTGENPEDLLYADMGTIMDKAVSKGFKEDDVALVIQHIYDKWLERLHDVMDNHK